MNDTCHTTVHNGDSLLSDKEDSGCQPSDVPLARSPEAGLSFHGRGSCGRFSAFSVFLPDMRAFPVPEPTCVDTCRCGMAFFPA